MTMEVAVVGRHLAPCHGSVPGGPDSLACPGAGEEPGCAHGAPRGSANQVRTATVMSIPEAGTARVDIDEAARQLELAAHDARVAFDCIDLGELDRAHTHAITARAAADAAENILRTALGDRLSAYDES